MAESLARYLAAQPARRETPELLAERAARFALECRVLRRDSGVERRFAGVRLDHLPDWLPAGYRELAGILLATVDERPQLIAIGGERGTGKTALACAAVTACCDRLRRGLYRTAKDYLDELSGAPWERKEAVRAACEGASVLVLDEVQVREEGREWQQNELIRLIDTRYARCLTTILLSNLTPEGFKANVGDSVWRRVAVEGGGCVAADWPRIETLKPRDCRVDGMVA